MTRTGTIAVLGLVLGLVAIVVLRSTRGAGTAEPVSAGRAPATSARSEERPLSVEGSARINRVPWEAPASDGPGLVVGTSGQGAAPDLSRVRSVSGRVVDTTGAGLGSVPVVVRAGGRIVSRVVSSPIGDFSTKCDHGVRASVYVLDEDYVTVLMGSIEPEKGDVDKVVVVAERAIDLRGTVADPGGDPVAGAEVSLVLHREFRARFDLDLGGSAAAGWGGLTGSDGGFRLERVPSLLDALLVVKRAGYRTHEEEAPRETVLDLRIVVEPAFAEDGFLSGRVRTTQGQGVEGAWVAIGPATAITAGDGGFTLNLDLAKGDVLQAVHSGYQPARLYRDTSEPDPGGWPGYAELMLDAPSLEVRGRVEFGDGSPVAGARVSLIDPSYFGWVKRGHGDTRFFNHATIETLAGSALSTDPYGATLADELGLFTLGGLSPREYRFMAVDPQSLAAEEFGPLKAGPGQVLVVIDRGDVSPVAGVVRDLGGEPLEGVLIMPRRTIQQDVEGNDEMWEMALGEYQFTDASGGFRVEGLVPGGVELFISGEPLGMESRTVELSEAPNLTELDLVLAGWCKLQVIAQEYPAARAFRVLDALGEPLSMEWRRGDITFAADYAPLQSRRSEVVTVNERASELHLLDTEDRVLARFPLDLLTDELNRLEL
jgi:hypothetical protein